MPPISPIQSPSTKHNTPTIGLKIVLIGDPGVGKTSIRRSYTWQDFRLNYLPTLGADFAQITTTIHGISTNIALWDLSGQQRFKESQPQYFIGSHAAIVIYNAESESLLENAINWIDRYIEYSGNTTEPILLLQNKTDLISPTQEVEKIALHEQLIERLNIYYHRRLAIIGGRASAKTGENVRSTLNSFFKSTIDHHNLNKRALNNLTNQINNGLYSKSTYLMSFDEDYGPFIVDKSPRSNSYSTKEITYAARLFSLLDFDILKQEGFRFGLAPWPAENANLYYLAFTLPNENIRGGNNMFVMGISISKDLRNLLAGSHHQIEGLLLNSMNSLSESLIKIQDQITMNNDILAASETVNSNIEQYMYKLRLLLDRMIRELLFD